MSLNAAGRRLLPLLGVLLLLVAGRADPGTGEAPARAASLADILDSFLARHAAENPAWRRDIRFVASPGIDLPAGFSQGHSDRAGWFQYRPQTAATLGPAERRGIFRDPRFLSYLASLRDRTDGRVPRAVEPAKTLPLEATRAELLARLREQAPAMRTPFEFSVTAAQLLAPGPVIVALGSRESDSCHDPLPAP